MEIGTECVEEGEHVASTQFLQTQKNTFFGLQGHLEEILQNSLFFQSLVSTAQKNDTNLMKSFAASLS